jgi:hypothetical protein
MFAGKDHYRMLTHNVLSNFHIFLMIKAPVAREIKSFRNEIKRKSFAILSL